MLKGTSACSSLFMEYFSLLSHCTAAFRGTPAEHAAEEPGLEYVFRRLWEMNIPEALLRLWLEKNLFERQREPFLDRPPLLSHLARGVTVHMFISNISGQVACTGPLSPLWNSLCHDMMPLHKSSTAAFVR